MSLFKCSIFDILNIQHKQMYCHPASLTFDRMFCWKFFGNISPVLFVFCLGFNSLFDNLEVFAKQQGYEWS